MSNLKSCLKRFWIYHSLYAFTMPVKIKSHGAKNHKKSWPPDSLKYENEKNENRCKQLFDDDHFGIWRWMSHREGLAALALNGGAALYTYKMIKEIEKITKNGSVKRCEVQHWYQTQNPHMNLNLLKLFICNWASWCSLCNDSRYLWIVCIVCHIIFTCSFVVKTHRLSQKV